MKRKTVLVFLLLSSLWTFSFVFAQETSLSPNNAASIQEVARFGMGDARSFATSPDGTRYTVAMGIGGVRVYDTGNFATPIQVFGIPNVLATYVQFSPDNRLIAVAYDDNTARLYDASTFQEVRVLSGHTSALKSLAFSPDGTRLVTGAGDDTLRIWEVATGTNTLTITLEDWAWRVAFSPDGAKVAVTYNNMTSVWDAQTGNPLAQITDDASFTSGVFFSPDSQHVLTADNDSLIRVYNISTASLEKALVHGDMGVRGVAFDPQNPRQFISTGFDNVVRRWDIDTATELAQAPTRYALVEPQFLPDGRIIAGSFTNGVGILDANLNQQDTPSDITAYINSIVIAPDGRIATGYGGGGVFLIDPIAGTRQPIIEGNPQTGTPSHTVYTPDFRYLVVGYGARMVRVYDTGNNYALVSEFATEASVSRLRISPDGNRVLVAGSFPYALLLDMPNLNEVTRLPHDINTYQLAISPDNATFATSDRERVKVWDANTFELRFELQEVEGNRAEAFVFAPDSQSLIVSWSTFDDNIIQYDANTGDLLRGADTEFAQELTFSPDNQLLVGMNFNDLNFMDASTLTSIVVLEDAYYNRGYYGLFSADGRFIYVLGNDSILRVFGLPNTLPSVVVTSDALPPAPEPSVVATGSCEDITFTKTDGVSGEVIEVFGLPASFTSPVGLLAPIESPERGAIVLVQRRPADPEPDPLDLQAPIPDPAQDVMALPLHPIEPLQGGEAVITFYDAVDKSLVCDGFAFTLNPLVPDNGVYPRYVQALGRVLDAQLRLIGLTRADLYTLSPDSPFELALMAQTLYNYDHPENPNSLVNIANGTAPILAEHAGKMDIVSGLIVANDWVGVLEGWATDLESFEAPPASLYQRAEAQWLSAVDAPIAYQREGVFRVEISSAEQLSYHMTRQSHYEAGSKGRAKQIMDNINLGGTVVGVALPGIGTLIGSASYVIGNINSLWADLLPSKFTSFSYEVTIPSYDDEDDDRLGEWFNTQVSVTSRQWNGTLAVIDGLLTVVGIKAVDSAVTKRVVETGRLYGDISLSLSPDGAASFATNFCGRGVVTCPGDGTVIVGPYTWSDISLDEPSGQWTYGKVDRSGTIELGENNTYRAGKSGLGRLHVFIHGEFFSHETEYARTDIPVGEIVVIVSPPSETAEPGDLICFSGEVLNAIDTSLEWTSSTGEASQVTSGSPSTYCVEAPEVEAKWSNWITCEIGPQPIPENFRITAKSLANTGPRALANAPIRADSVTLRVIGTPSDAPPPPPEECIELNYEEGDWLITAEAQTFTCFEASFPQTINLPALENRLDIEFPNNQQQMVLLGGSLSIFDVANSVGGQQGSIMSQLASELSNVSDGATSSPPLTRLPDSSVYQYGESYEFQNDTGTPAKLDVLIRITMTDAENFTGFSRGSMSLPIVGDCVMELPVTGRYVGQ